MRNFRVVLLTAAAFAACTQQHQSPELPVGEAKQAASAEPTLVTIAVNGAFDDWTAVLQNPLQVSSDGNGIDSNGCYPTLNPDRDCDDFTTQRDITTFAWTYDDDNVYTYVRRPPSASTLTYSFIMDVNADGFAGASDRVMQVEWKSGDQALAVRLYAYAPVAGGLGDPIACPNTATCVSAGNANAATDFIDGYDMPGALGALLWSPPAPGCPGSGAGDECGGDDRGTNGQEFETFVPWTQLGVPARSPIIWHVASSTNTAFSNASDNVGGPDGKAGLFGAFGVDFRVDRLGAADAQAPIDYCHTIENTGDLPDRYNLRAVSNLGSRVQLFNADGSCVVGSQIADDLNGDGDFADPGESGSAGDTNADGLPDTGVIPRAGTFNLVVRVTSRAGVLNATDVTTATARSVLRPIVSFDDVIDRTRIGPVTVHPDFALSGTPGATVDFGPFTVQNNTASTSAFDLTVRSSHGYPLQLFTDNVGVIGTLIASDANGDGVWDAATPSTGPLTSGSNVRYWVREFIPGGAPLNTVDSMRLTATLPSNPLVINGSAFNILRVLGPLTISPSHTAPSGQLFGPAGSSVFLPHRVINSHGLAQTVTLSQSGTALPAGWTMRWWSDPNGDGSIADGALINSFVVQPFGGTVNLVTEVRIASPAGATDSTASTTVTGSLTGSAAANDHVSVGNLQTFEDPLFARPTRFFPACSTVHARALGLNVLTSTAYQMRFDNPAGTTVQSRLFTTNGAGVGSDSYALGSTDASGAWRVRTFQSPFPPGTQRYDLNPFTVESSGTVIAQAPATAVNGPVAVSAQLTSTAQQSDHLGSQLRFELRDPSNVLMDTIVGTQVDIPFGASTVGFDVFPSVTFSVFGNYTVTATWLTSCGTVIDSASTTIARAPPAPTLVSPADGAVIANSSPNLTGTAQPNATVNITRDGVVVGTATANGSGNFTFASAVLSQGLHTWSATQTVGGATGPASSAFSFTVDTVAPAAVVLIDPVDGVRTNDTTPTLDGTAEANSSVAVSIGATVVGTVTANGSGAWTYTLIAGQALAQGTYTATAVSTDAAGNASPVSNANTFTIDTTLPAAPTVTNPANGSVTSSTQPTVDGTTEPNAQVQVIVDGNVVATVLADGSGNWSYTLSAGQALGNGPHTAAARATDVAGNLGPASADSSFTVDTSVPPAPVVVTPANGSRTNDTTPTISGTVSYPAASVEVFIGGASVGVIPGPILGGTWSYTLAIGQALSPGNHSATAQATDLALTTSPISAANTFTVDTTNPPAPVVLTPAHLARTNDTTPLISGTAEANASVAVFIDGNLMGTVNADSAGDWDYTVLPGQALVAGTYVATAQATDLAGNTGLVTTPGNSFTVDLTLPSPPLISAPLDGSRSNDPTPTIVGTAEANATVTVFIEGNLVGTVPADASGNWSYTLLPGQSLVEGTYTATASATDQAGNLGSTSAGVAFTVDVTPPPAPVTLTPADGARTTDTTPDVTGTAEANASVQVLIDGNPVGSTTANGGGSWTFTVPTSLGGGDHTASARATDLAGNTGVQGNINTFTVDTAAPNPPAVVAPADGARTNDTTPDVSGTAEADATVQVVIDGTPVGSTTANGSGAWTFTVPSTLAEGSHTASARATDVAGNTSGLSNVNTFTVDSSAPPAPVVATPADGSRTNDTTPTIGGTAEANASVQVMIDGNVVGTVTADSSGNWTYPLLPGQALVEGTYAATARATDVAGNLGPASAANAFTVDLTAPAAPAITAPVNNSTIADNTPTISGTAEANATVVVTVDGMVVGTVTADASGNFSYTLTSGQSLSSAAHTASARATDVAGNQGPSSANTTCTVDADVPNAPVVVTPANGSRSNDDTPTVTGTSDPGVTVQITIDGTVVATVTADAQGNWAYTLSTAQALTDGSHVASAVATDVAGNASPRSNQNTWVVDATAPGAPVITSPTNGATTFPQPPITGTAEPGSTVRVFIDGALAGTAIADPQGEWTFTPSAPLTAGQHTVAANATDADGNTGPNSTPVGFTVTTTDGGTGGGAGGGGGQGGGNGAGGGGQPPIYGYRGGGCGCTSVDGSSLALAFAALAALGARRRRRS